MGHKHGEIDKDLLHRILVEGFQLGLRRVGLYTVGEMFLCKDIVTHIRNAKKVGYEYVYADTNGALANEERLESVIKAELDSIKFSINAGKKETYAVIHGRDDFDEVIGNLRICHKLKLKLNPKLKIMVSFVVTRQTEEVELLQELVSPYIDVFVPHAVRAFFQQHDDDISHMRTKTYGGNERGNTIPCSMVLNRIHVTNNGYYSACCVDFNHDLLLADLKTMPLAEAWTSESALSFKRKHLLRQIEGTMCHGCSMGRFIPYSPLTT